MTAVQAPTLMTVGELSRRTGIPVKALREYTDWGLIYTLGRNGANYRLYDDEALRCVQGITGLRGLGLTLAEIRWLASSYRDQNGQLVGPRLAERLQAARARVDAQIAQLERTRHRIDAFEASHSGALAGQPGAEIWSSAADPCAASA